MLEYVVQARINIEYQYLGNVESAFRSNVYCAGHNIVLRYVDYVGHNSALISIKNTVSDLCIITWKWLHSRVAGWEGNERGCFVPIQYQHS